MIFLERNLKNDCFYIWRNKYERAISTGEFKPLFVRYIGVQDKDLYCDILKTLDLKCNENPNVSLIFDGNIEMSGEFELIELINSELKNMDIANIESQDIVIFNDIEVNNVFLKSLGYVVNLAIKNENFFNESVRNNFITKLIVWAYIHLKSIRFNDDINPKCIYYGEAQRHEIYFLILLHLMSFDVLYLNPLKEEHWDSIDVDNVSTLQKYMQIMDIESFEAKVQKGNVIELTESLTKQLKKDIEKKLYTDTGVYKDWQFRDGYTKSLFIDSLLEDVNIYWKEQARFREGFAVNDNTVTVPCFFQKIEGLYKNEDDYLELIQNCTTTPNTLVIDNCKLSSDIKVSENMYELIFCQLSDGTFDIEKIKNLEMYKFHKYSDEIQNLILNKFNETLLDKNIYSFELDKNDMLQLLVLVIQLNEEIIRLIDNFDFTKDIPKIVIFLNNEDSLSDNMLLLLGYLHKIGMDIIIFNPSGLFNTNKIINPKRINITRLEQMKYDLDYKNLKAKKKNFFARFFK